MFGLGKSKTQGYEVKVIMGDFYDNQMLLERAKARIERLTAKLARCKNRKTGLIRLDQRIIKEIERDIKRWEAQEDLLILILNVEERGIKA